MERGERDAGEDIDPLLERQADHPPEREEADDHHDADGGVGSQAPDSRPLISGALEARRISRITAIINANTTTKRVMSIAAAWPYWVKLNGGVVGVDADQLGGRPGAAARQHEDLVERPDRVDEPQDDPDGHDRHQHLTVEKIHLITEVVRANFNFSVFFNLKVTEKKLLPEEFQLSS